MGYLFFLLLSTVVCNIGAELFTSSAHLQTALYAERDIAQSLRSYAEQEEARLAQIRKLADDYEDHSNRILKDIDGHLGNPVNAFLFIKHFTLDWDKDVLPILSNNTWETMNQEIENVRSDLPSFEDLKGAAAALMRLQDTYHLDTVSVANGNLRGIRSPVLSAMDCFLLGRLSYQISDHYHSSLWFHAALHLDKGEREKTIRRAEGLDYLAYSEAMLGNLPVALKLTDELLTLDPSHERAASNKVYFERMISEDFGSKSAKGETHMPGYQQNRDSYRNSEEFLLYEALCRGEETQPLKDQHKFTCRYKTNNHPWLLLQPVKEETAHLDPWLVIYHDIISDEEIEVIKELATPRLNRATVQNSKTGELETAHYRISKSAWLKEVEHPVVARFNKRMQAVTGLDMDTAEELQIANYGIGGQYEPHFDYARKEEKEAFKSLGTGNRIATFLNYLSDVEAGGATVFPYIGLKLFPKKGNAAFWYNLRRSGEGIYNTRHAACPVLVGTKWVANKWIHERGQEFRRQCSVNEFE